MADSIAKLSVIITGDTSPLGRSLNTAGNDVRQFARNVETGGGSLLSFQRGTKLASTGLTAMRGNLLPLIGALGPGGGLAIGIGSAVALFGLLAKKSIEARDALAVQRGEESLSKEYERLSTVSTDFLATLGEITGLHAAARQEAATWARILRDINEYLKTDEMKEREQLFKKQTKALEDQKRAAAEFAAADKQASQERQRSMDEAKRRAEAITESLRTPPQVFADSVAELNKLFQLGLVGLETYQAGIAKARTDLDDAAARATSIQKTLSATPVAAAERFTQAGASAVTQARIAQQAFDLQRKEFEVAKKQMQFQEEGNRILKEKKPVVLTAGRF